MKIGVTQKYLEDQLRAGEKLRWIPSTITGKGYVTTATGKFATRDLHLGRTKLSDEDAIFVTYLVQDGELSEHEDATGCVDITLPEIGGGE